MNQKEAAAVKAAVLTIDEMMKAETEQVVKGRPPARAAALKRRDELFALRRLLAETVREALEA